MTEPCDLIEDARRGIDVLRQLGCTVALAPDGGLILRGPRHTLRSDVLALLRERKAALVEVLRAEGNSTPGRGLEYPMCGR